MVGARVEIVAYDPAWARYFEAEEAAIRTALGTVARRIEHIGSTSVPGLAAKPIVDILLVVDDSRDENQYVAALEAAGFTFHRREPDFHEHRLLHRRRPNTNLHVFSLGNQEIERYLLFRDRLRSEPAERDLYEQTKRRLANQLWLTTNDYAVAKSAVVEAIIGRARAVNRP